jgi:hypothetical protein
MAFPGKRIGGNSMMNLNLNRKFVVTFGHQLAEIVASQVVGRVKLEGLSGYPSPRRMRCGQ